MAEADRSLSWQAVGAGVVAAAEQEVQNLAELVHDADQDALLGAVGDTGAVQQLRELSNERWICIDSRQAPCALSNVTGQG